MQLTFLGTAAAEGFPDPFCACANCEAARAEGGASVRLRSAALVNDDLLIDFGPDIANAAVQFGTRLMSIPFALQTHPHGDHLDATAIFSRARRCQTEGLTPTDYYCAQATIDRLDQMLGLVARGLSFTQPDVQAEFSLTPHAVAPWQEFQAGPYRVQSVLANHDAGVEAMLFAIEDTERGGRLFYGTDTGSLPVDTFPRLATLGWTFDVLILDHTFGYAQRADGHMNHEQFLEEVAAARSSGVIDEDTRIYATHIAHHSNPAHGALVKLATERDYLIGYDGLTIDTAEKGALSGANARTATV